MIEELLQPRLRANLDDETITLAQFCELAPQLGLNPIPEVVRLNRLGTYIARLKEDNPRVVEEFDFLPCLELATGEAQVEEILFENYEWAQYVIECEVLDIELRPVDDQ